MSQRVRSVQIVSDGVIVEFSDGAAVYFSADFLSDHIGQGSNQMLLDYDPSPAPGDPPIRIPLPGVC